MIREGLGGQSFKATFHLYLFGLLLLTPGAALAAWLFDSAHAAFATTLLLAAVLAGAEYAFSNRDRASRHSVRELLGGVRGVDVHTNESAVPVIQRVLDIAVAATILTVLAPPMAILALLIKFESPRGPIFYRSLRVGRFGRAFEVVKFRTIETTEILPFEVQFGGGGPVLKLHADPRVTRVGRFLRRSALDELPQLWNVLRGEMSLVGPRAPFTWERTEELLNTPGLISVSGRHASEREVAVLVRSLHRHSWSPSKQSLARRKYPMSTLAVLTRMTWFISKCVKGDASRLFDLKIGFLEYRALLEQLSSVTNVRRDLRVPERISRQTS